MRPKKVVIDGQELPIEWVKPKGRTAEGYGFAGEYQPNKLRIATTMTDSMEKLTVFCELLHLAFHRGGLRETYSIKTEEYIVHEFASWFWEVLRQNPQLRAYFWEDK